MSENDTLGTRLEELLRELIRDELGRLRTEVSSSLGDYDQAACAALARELGMNSLNRAGDFFAKLNAAGAADSLTMAEHLSLGTPRNISSALTTPVKRVAKRLGLGLPWAEEVSPGGRIVWRDRDGISARMCEAVKEEQHRRETEPFRR